MSHALCNITMLNVMSIKPLCSVPAAVAFTVPLHITTTFLSLHSLLRLSFSHGQFTHSRFIIVTIITVINTLDKLTQRFLIQLVETEYCFSSAYQKPYQLPIHPQQLLSACFHKQQLLFTRCTSTASCHIASTQI